MDNITITFKWTEDLFKQAMRYHFQHSTNPFNIYLSYGVGFLFLVAAIIVFDQENIFPSIVLILAGIYFGLLKNKINFFAATQGFQKRPDCNAEIQWTFNADYITSDINQSYHSELPWDGISEIIKIDNNYLLYTNEKFFYFIPTESLSNDERNRLHSLIKNKILNFETTN